MVLEEINSGLVKDILQSHEGLLSLSLKSNRLREVGPYLREVATLERLDLSDNVLCHLESLAFANLTALNISCNRLTSLDGITACPLLRKLDASNNQLETLSPNLPFLTSLDLSHNRLRCESLRDLSRIAHNSLVKLNLRNNSISSLSSLTESLGGARSSLKQLKLRDNLIDLGFDGVRGFFAEKFPAMLLLDSQVVRQGARRRVKGNGTSNATTPSSRFSESNLSGHPSTSSSGTKGSAKYSGSSAGQWSGHHAMDDSPNNGVYQAEAGTADVRLDTRSILAEFGISLLENRDTSSDGGHMNHRYSDVRTSERMKKERLPEVKERVEDGEEEEEEEEGGVIRTDEGSGTVRKSTAKPLFSKDSLEDMSVFRELSLTLQDSFEIEAEREEKKSAPESLPLADIEPQQAGWVEPLENIQHSLSSISNDGNALSKTEWERLMSQKSQDYGEEGGELPRPVETVPKPASQVEPALPTAVKRRAPQVNYLLEEYSQEYTLDTSSSVVIDLNHYEGRRIEFAEVSSDGSVLELSAVRCSQPSVGELRKINPRPHPVLEPIAPDAAEAEDTLQHELAKQQQVHSEQHHILQQEQLEQRRWLQQQQRQQQQFLQQQVQQQQRRHEQKEHQRQTRQANPSSPRPISCIEPIERSSNLRPQQQSSEQQETVLEVNPESHNVSAQTLPTTTTTTSQTQTPHTLDSTAQTTTTTTATKQCQSSVPQTSTGTTCCTETHEVGVQSTLPEYVTEALQLCQADMVQSTARCRELQRQLDEALSHTPDDTQALRIQQLEQENAALRASSARGQSEYTQLTAANRQLTEQLVESEAAVRRGDGAAARLATEEETVLQLTRLAEGLRSDAQSMRASLEVRIEQQCAQLQTASSRELELQAQVNTLQSDRCNLLAALSSATRPNDPLSALQISSSLLSLSSAPLTANPFSASTSTKHSPLLAP